MPKYTPKQICFKPKTEYHVTTATGTVCQVFDKFERAVLFLGNSNKYDRRIIQVIVNKEDVTPLHMSSPSNIALCA